MVSRTTTRCLLCLLLCSACAGARQAYAQWVPRLASVLENNRLSFSPSGFSSSAHTVSLRFPIGGPHALNVSGEYFRASSAPRAYRQQPRLEPDWKFRSVPITVSYSYSLPALTHRLHPVLGLGVSSHLYYERTRIGLDAANLPAPGFDRHYGVSLGAEATMGMRLVMNPHVFFLAQSRLRYVGNLSTRSLNDTYGPFTVVDFSLGLGFEL